MATPVIDNPKMLIEFSRKAPEATSAEEAAIIPQPQANAWYNEFYLVVNNRLDNRPSTVLLLNEQDALALAEALIKICRRGGIPE